METGNNYNDMVIKYEDGFTTYRNLDLQMVDNIKKFKSPIIFNYLNHKNSTKVKDLDETQFLFIDDNGKYFVLEKNSYDKNIKENKLEYINETYCVVDAIEKSFPNGLFSEDGFIEYRFLNKKGSLKNDYTSRTYYQTGIKYYFYDNEVEIELINIENHNSLAFVYLNEDGNICCRDYNFDIKKYIGNKKSTKHDLIKLIINQIPDIQYQNYGNLYFTDKFALKLDGYNILRFINNNNNQYTRGREKIKIPKKLTTVTRNNILSKLLPSINDLPYFDKIDLSSYIDVENNKNENLSIDTNTRRIQETIINEDDYYVIDLTDESDYIYENNEIIECLKNIEYSIDIPSNVCKVIEFIPDILSDCELPSFSFYKGEKQPKHSKFKGLVVFPHNCYFTFNICEGGVSELTHDHSIYQTDIIDIEFVY